MGSLKRQSHLLGLFALVLVALVMPVAASATSPVPLGRAASAPPELAVSFEEQSMIASGLTPGGEAVLFGLAVRPMGFYNSVERYDDVVLADATGTARLELEGELPLRAVWAVIDLASGEVTTSPTPGFPRQAQPFPTAGLRGRGGAVDRLRQALESAHVLYARPGPGGGVWGTAVDDGGGYDLDGATDGTFELALAELFPVGASPAEPPSEVLAGDVLVVVDPAHLSLFTLRVTPDVLAAALAASGDPS